MLRIGRYRHRIISLCYLRTSRLASVYQILAGQILLVGATLPQLLERDTRLFVNRNAVFALVGKSECHIWACGGVCCNIPQRVGILGLHAVGALALMLAVAIRQVYALQ